MHITSMLAIELLNKQGLANESLMNLFAHRVVLLISIYTMLTFTNASSLFLVDLVRVSQTLARRKVCSSCTVSLATHNIVC